jgi:hypothetical protein
MLRPLPEGDAMFAADRMTIRPRLWPTLAAGLLLVIVSGCSPNWMPSQRTIYRSASAALLATPEVPDDARLAPLENCRLYVGKNAARIDIPAEFQDAGGATASRTYTIWMKRVARTWVIDRVLPPLDPAVER